MKNNTSQSVTLALALSFLVVPCLSRAADAPPAGKTFIDYFEPTPILSPLSKDAWGAATVGPRDQQNGLEDTALKQWNYWDGRILKSAGRQIPLLRQPLGTGQGPQRVAQFAGHPRRQR